MTRRSLSVDSVLLGAAMGVAQVSTAVTFVLAARAAGVSGMGVIASTVALGALAASLVDFGENAFLLREQAAGRMTDAEFRSRVGGKLVLLGAFLALAALGHVVWPSFSYVILVMVGTLIPSIAYVALRSSHRVLLLALCMVIDRLAFLGGYAVATIALELSPRASLYYSQIVGGLIAAVVAFVGAPRERRPRFSQAQIRFLWRGTAGYGLSSVAVNAQGLDTVIAAAAAGPSVAGGFGAVNRWIAPIKLVSSTFSLALAPSVAAAKSGKDVWGRIRGSLWIPSAACLVAVLVGMLADPLVSLLLGSEFSDSVDALRLLAANAALSALSQPIFVVLQNRRRERDVARVMLASVGVQLALVAPLAFVYGAVGVSLAGLCGQVVILISMLLLIFRPALRALRKAP